MHETENMELKPHSLQGHSLSQESNLRDQQMPIGLIHYMAPRTERHYSDLAELSETNSDYCLYSEPQPTGKFRDIGLQLSVARALRTHYALTH